MTDRQTDRWTDRQMDTLPIARSRSNIVGGKCSLQPLPLPAGAHDRPVASLLIMGGGGVLLTF